MALKDAALNPRPSVEITEFCAPLFDEARSLGARHVPITYYTCT